MNKKIKIAAIKYCFFASGGTEKFLQTVVANLPKDRFDVDVYYTNAAPYLGSSWTHPDNEQQNIDYVKNSGCNLIPVHVEHKDVRVPTHDWIGTDFWELFDESKYDLILCARAGHSENPFNKIVNTPIIELVTLPGMSDNQENIFKSVHISHDQLNSWLKVGGNATKAVVIPLFSERVKQSGNCMREELKIPKDAFVFGMHQRDDDGIASMIALEAYKKIMNDNTWFIIMGGSKLYLKFAQENNLKNFVQLPFSGHDEIKDKFLATLNVFAGSRRDGDTFGNSYSEALSYGKPCLSHIAPAMGHLETIGNAGKVCESIDEYSFLMNKLMNDKNFYNQLSENAFKQYNEKLSIEINMNKIVNIIDEVSKEKEKDLMSDEDFWSTVNDN